jgi:hypothetical protein
MILSAWVPAWCLDEERRVLAIGDRFSSWLTFEETAPPDADDMPGVQTLAAVARPLPRWDGELSPHPVVLDVDGGTLYWDAARPVAGPVAVTGTVSFNNVDAPDGFPETAGVLRRVRMRWTPTHGHARYTRHEDVERSYLPSWDEAPPASVVRTSRVRLRWAGCLVDLELGATEA